jgi:hypothetical protein
MNIAIITHDFGGLGYQALHGCIYGLTMYITIYETALR